MEQIENNAVQNETLPKKEKKATGKKALIILIAVISVLGSLALTLFAPWISINGIKKRELKEIGKEAESSYESIYNLTESYDEEDEKKLEGLFRNDVFSGKADLKRYIKTSKQTIKKFTSAKYSFFDLVQIYDWGTDTVNRAYNALGTKYANYLLVSDIDEDSVEELGEMTGTLTLISVCVKVFFIILILLALAAAVFEIAGRFPGFKIAYFVITFILAGLTVALAILSKEFIPDAVASLGISEGKAALAFTLAPIVSAVLAFLPLILRPIFIKKNKKSE